MPDDGRSDFDFIFGSWIIRNRKLVDVADPACEDWVEFEASSEAFPILDRYGHVDRMFVQDPPDGASFEGFTLRPAELTLLRAGCPHGILGDELGQQRGERVNPELVSDALEDPYLRVWQHFGQRP